MGQSVSRVNDRSSVPGPLGHGVGERPMIGVGREGGHEECATPETAGVPNPTPIRRKQTLGDQHHPPAVKEAPKDDEQKGFRGRLRRGWLTTIGVFHRKHDSTNKKNDDISSNTSTSGIASSKTVSTPTSQPLSPTAPASSSSSVIPPSSPPSSSGRSRAMSSPSLSSSSLPKGQSPVLSPTMRPRSDSMTSQPSSLVMHDKEKDHDKDKEKDDGIQSSKQLHASQGHQYQQEKPMTGNEMAAARAAAMKSGKSNDEQQHQQQQQHHGDVATSPRGGIHQVGSTGGSGGGMALWWRNHHPNLEKMMPPKYAPGNSQPDELHRESRDPTYQASNPMEVHEPNSPSISKGGMVGSFDEAIPPTTMKPHVSRNISGGVHMNPRKRSASPNRDAQMNDNDNTSTSTSGGGKQHGYIREHGSLERGMKQYGDTSVLPPMMSPWNTQPDELHREPRWRSNKTSGIGISTGIGSSGDGGGSDSNHGGYGSGGNDNRRMSHSHWWQPGGTSLHNNDQHTQPGGWPMNP